MQALPWTVVNTAKAVLPGMVSRGEGQFAAVSSMAANPNPNPNPNLALTLTLSLTLTPTLTLTLTLTR